jgi:hypothetical protein
MEQPRLLLDRTRHRWIVVSQGDGDWRFVVATDTLGGGRPRTIEVGPVAGPNDVGERMAQPLIAFANGDVVWLTLPQLRRNGGTLMPLLYTFGSALRWEVRGTDGAGDHVLADVEGFMTCRSELDEAGAMCVDRSPSGSRLWRVSSARRLTRVADLPPAFDIVHHSSEGLTTLAERSGGRLAVLDVARMRGMRLNAAEAEPGRWITDAVVAGKHLFLLAVGRDGTKLRRLTIR